MIAVLLLVLLAERSTCFRITNTPFRRSLVLLTHEGSMYNENPDTELENFSEVKHNLDVTAGLRNENYNDGDKDMEVMKMEPFNMEEKYQKVTNVMESRTNNKKSEPVKPESIKNDKNHEDKESLSAANKLDQKLSDSLKEEKIEIEKTDKKQVKMEEKSKHETENVLKEEKPEPSKASKIPEAVEKKADPIKIEKKIENKEVKSETAPVQVKEKEKKSEPVKMDEEISTVVEKTEAELKKEREEALEKKLITIKNSRNEQVKTLSEMEKMLKKSMELQEEMEKTITNEVNILRSSLSKRENSESERKIFLQDLKKDLEVSYEEKKIKLNSQSSVVEEMKALKEKLVEDIIIKQLSLAIEAKQEIADIEKKSFDEMGKMLETVNLELKEVETELEILVKALKSIPKEDDKEAVKSYSWAEIGKLQKIVTENLQSASKRTDVIPTISKEQEAMESSLKSKLKKNEKPVEITTKPRGFVTAKPALKKEGIPKPTAEALVGLAQNALGFLQSVSEKQEAYLKSTNIGKVKKTLVSTETKVEPTKVKTPVKNVLSNSAFDFMKTKTNKPIAEITKTPEKKEEVVKKGFFGSLGTFVRGNNAVDDKVLEPIFSNFARVAGPAPTIIVPKKVPLYKKKYVQTQLENLSNGKTNVRDFYNSMCKELGKNKVLPISEELQKSMPKYLAKKFDSMVKADIGKK